MRLIFEWHILPLKKMEKERKIGVGLVLYVTCEMRFQTDDTENPTSRRVRMQGGNLNELESSKIGTGKERQERGCVIQGYVIVVRLR